MELVKEQFKPNLEADAAFDRLFSLPLQSLSRRHWTPLSVVQKATEFLASGTSSKILDIGSGTGKFCLSAARLAPENHFYGIEQRQYLYNEAQIAQKKTGLLNVSFTHGNFTQLDLKQFDHFYFFNSFYENIHEEGRMDDHIDYSASLYNYYVRFLRQGLQAMPIGTKIATFHSLQEEIPLSYDLVDTQENGELNFWMKRVEH
jgi:SAM-dependent methyltransferase